jgi:hypothetical protein
MRGFALIGSTLLVATVIGCGGGGSTPALTASDVSNIPPGSAAGTALSGAYLVTSSAITGCNCRVGSCGQITPTPIGATFEVTQQGGTLSMVASTDTTQTPAVGGVDADNSFSVGQVAQVPADLGQGAAYELVHGQFNVANGLPTGMTCEVEETVTATVEGTSYDCDLSGSVGTVYEGAITAALEVPAGRAAAAAFETSAGRIGR